MKTRTTEVTIFSSECSVVAVLTYVGPGYEINYDGIACATVYENTLKDAKAHARRTITYHERQTRRENRRSV